MNHQQGIFFLSQDAMPICERDLTVKMASPMPLTEFEQFFFVKNANDGDWHDATLLKRRYPVV